MNLSQHACTSDAPLLLPCDESGSALLSVSVSRVPQLQRGKLKAAEASQDAPVILWDRLRKIVVEHHFASCFHVMPAVFRHQMIPNLRPVKVALSRLNWEPVVIVPDSYKHSYLSLVVCGASREEACKHAYLFIKRQAEESDIVIPLVKNTVDISLYLG